MLYSALVVAADEKHLFQSKSLFEFHKGIGFTSKGLLVIQAVAYLHPCFLARDIEINLHILIVVVEFFSIAFVLVGLLAKVIGCGAMSGLCGYKGMDKLKIGIGMMTRGEVALIVSQRGLKAGIIGSEYFTAVILLIIVSSIVTPILCPSSP